MMKIIGLVLGALVLLPSCGGGSAAAPATANAACREEVAQACDRAYACVAVADRDTDFTDQYGTSLADCKSTVVDAQCATAAADCPTYDATKVAACDSETAHLTCPQFFDPTTPTPACDAVCP